jgi:hypothetical protein
LTAWHEHDRGGHFPAVAEPHLVARTLRDTFRPFAAPADTTYTTRRSGRCSHPHIKQISAFCVIDAARFRYRMHVGGKDSVEVSVEAEQD